METRLPEGVQDFLTVEYYNKKEIENKIGNYFALCGFRQVESPIFEYADVFTKVKAPIPDEKTFKFFEMGKKTMALRADATIPLARMAAEKMKNVKLPIRLSYITNIYRIEDSQRGLQREIGQAGVELIGVKSAEADAEVITLAIESLIKIGLENFKIDIGQVDFFKSIISDSQLSQQQIEDIRVLINQKSTFELENYIKDIDIDYQIKKAICALPQLYGNQSMLEEAKALAINDSCVKAIDNLQDVYDIISQYGYEKYISFDLGMVQSLDYYSGIIFRGLVEGHGHAILGGGRYDKLMGEFGRGLPATGFAIGIKRVMVSLERQYKLNPLPPINYLVVTDESSRQKAYAKVKELREQHKSVEMFLKAVEDISPIEYAKSKQINTVISFEDGCETIQKLKD